MFVIFCKLLEIVLVSFERIIQAQCNSFLTFRMSQFRMNGWSFITAMSFITRNTSFAISNNGFDIDTRILNLFEREGFQYLMLFRVADVQMPISRRDAQIILICYLSRAITDLKKIKLYINLHCINLAKFEI